LFAAMLVLEGVGLTQQGHAWPTVSDLLRSMTRPVFGRWIFFALWLWVGWHFFIRGWQFFLQGTGAREPIGSGAVKSLFTTLTQVVVPLLALFVTFFLIGRASRRALATKQGADDDHAPDAILRQPSRYIRYALVTFVVGYGLFIGVIGIYQLVVGRGASGDFMSALFYGALLAFVVAVPLFLVLGFAQSELRARRHRVGDPP
jgi:hypothetical protein